MPTSVLQQNRSHRFNRFPGAVDFESTSSRRISKKMRMRPGGEKKLRKTNSAEITPLKFNIDTKKWSYSKGVTSSKPSFWVSIFAFGGVDSHQFNYC